MFSISDANAADTDKLVALVNSAYRGEGAKVGWTTEADLIDGTRIDANHINALFKIPELAILKCVDEGEIIGCAELKVTADSLYLGMLTVKPQLQGKGIGKALLLAAEKQAKQLNLQKIIMTVISVRTELIEWYQRHGYIKTGKMQPFLFTNASFGIPKNPLHFIELEKPL